MWSSTDGRHILGRATLEMDKGRAAATFSLPLPPSGNGFGPLTAKLGRTEFERIDLPDLAGLRAEQFARENLVAAPFVFSGDSFPPIDFEDPSLVEDLIGTYSLKTQFFDNDYRAVDKPSLPGRYGAAVDIASTSGQHYRRYVTLFRQPDHVDWRHTKVEFPPDAVTVVGIDPAVAAANSHAINTALLSELRRSYATSQRTAQLLGDLWADSAKSEVRTDAETSRWQYGLQKSLGDVTQYKYLLTLPDGYDADTTKHWPLVLFLHGSGERGSDLEAVKVHGPPKLVAAGRKFPFVLISPQCPDGSWWNSDQLSDLLDDIEAKYRIDTDRVYLTGLSMGGYGTYDLAMEEPARFAAISPISGAADPDFAYLIKGVPDWSFHGVKDPTVPYTDDKTFTDALKDAGGDVRFTAFPDGGHDVWTQVYAGDDIYTWLLSHTLKH